MYRSKTSILGKTVKIIKGRGKGLVGVVHAQSPRMISIRLNDGTIAYGKAIENVEVLN